MIDTLSLHPFRFFRDKCLILVQLLHSKNNFDIQTGLQLLILKLHEECLGKSTLVLFFFSDTLENAQGILIECCMLYFQYYYHPIFSGIRILFVVEAGFFHYVKSHFQLLLSYFS